MGDLVAVWEIALGAGVHKVEFEHGTISGKRVIRVDGKEVFRRDWMFKLVGYETFEIGKAKCVIYIEAASGFYYAYGLEVNGKSYKKFTENQSKIMRTWYCAVQEKQFRVVLEKDTLDVWVNGQKMDTIDEFVDDGTEMHFEINGQEAYIKAVSSGSRKEGLIHTLIFNGSEVPESV
uniref:Fas apoptotic inhibitory molecule 1 n=2 Tax=Strigamia maritima TaxID=126957 RepID=T1IVR5_STRMM